MSLILFCLCAGSFYAGFKCGHRFATLKSLADGAVAKVKLWAAQIVNK